MKNVAGGFLASVKPQIKVYDSNFAHATSCSNGDLKIYPQYFDWYRGSETRDIEIFVDGQYGQAPYSKAKIKIWMLLEPPSVSSDIYRLAREYIDYGNGHFDYILTFDKSLVQKISANPEMYSCKRPKVIYYPSGGCWINPEERLIYQKSKDISIIASGKNKTIGHKLRHEIIQRTRDCRVDVFGGGYKFIPNKLDALKDYRFSIVIENCQVDGYFTEKLIDCIVAGTIPIYWGSPSICSVFDLSAIVTFNTADELVTTISKIPHSDIYDNAFHGIIANHATAQKFVNTEDWLWLNFLKNLCTTIPTT